MPNQHITNGISCAACSAARGYVRLYSGCKNVSYLVSLDEMGQKQKNLKNV